MKKPRMDSTFSYIPFGALIEAPHMRRYHKKAYFASEEVRLGLSQEKTPRDSTQTYSPWGLTIGMGREWPLIMRN